LAGFSLGYGHLGKPQEKALIWPVAIRRLYDLQQGQKNEIKGV
jgi:hypothetical protein